MDEDTAVSSVLLTVAATDSDSSDTSDGQILYSLPTNPSAFEIKYSCYYIDINGELGEILLKNIVFH